MYSGWGFPTWETDPQGRFTLPSDRGAAYDLQFELDGMAPVFLNRVPVGTMLEVTMRPGLDVGGQVVVEGLRGGGVRVGLLRPNERGTWIERSVETGPDGRFEFPGVLGDEDWFLTLGGAPLPVDLTVDEPQDNI